MVTFSEPRFKTLVKNMLISTTCMFLTASSAGLGIYQGQQRGMQSYAQLLNGTDMELRPDQFYAFDLTVPGCLGFIISATVISIVSICLIIYFGYKTWKFLNFFSNQIQPGQSKSLQAQFTRYLIAQALVGICFAIAPVAFISFCMILQVDVNFLWILFPLTCVPALNVILTLLMVGTYRKCLFGLLCSVKIWSETSLINRFKPGNARTS